MQHSGCQLNSFADSSKRLTFEAFHNAACVRDPSASRVITHAVRTWRAEIPASVMATLLQRKRAEAHYAAPSSFDATRAESSSRDLDGTRFDSHSTHGPTVSGTNPAVVSFC